MRTFAGNENTTVAMRAREGGFSGTEDGNAHAERVRCTDRYDPGDPRCTFLRRSALIFVFYPYLCKDKLRSGPVAAGRINESSCRAVSAFSAEKVVPDMELKSLQSELQRLSALVDGWTDAEEIPALERDLALDKMRKLYDMLRFDNPAAVVAQISGAVLSDALDEPIDLGEVLALDEPTDGAGIADEPEQEAVTEELPAVAAESDQPREDATEQTETPSAGVATLAESETDLSEPFGVTDSAAGADSATASAVPAETTAEPASTTETPDLDTPSDAAIPVAAEAISAPAANPLSDPITGPATVAAPAAEPIAPKPGSDYVTPTLFGLEEATVRHRYKQRVIMSLYDSATPVSDPVPAVEKPQPAMPVQHPAEEQQPTEETEPSVPDTVPAGEVSGLPSEAQPMPPVAAEKEAVPAPASGSVLGEVINHDVQTLGDTIVPPRDVASELRRSEPVTDLRKAVGINDRFLMIRDLFDGDAAAYEAAVETFNGFSDLDECLIHIAEHYAWNANSDGAKLLMDLLERKFA